MVSFEKCPYFNWFASLFIVGKLLLNLLLLSSKILSIEKYIYHVSTFSFTSSWLTEGFLTLATSGRGRSHDKQIGKEYIWFSQHYILVHPQWYNNSLIIQKTLIASVLKVLWDWCPSPLPSFLELPTTVYNQHPLHSNVPDFSYIIKNLEKEKSYHRSYSIFIYAVGLSLSPWLVLMKTDLENPNFYQMFIFIS